MSHMADVWVPIGLDSQVTAASSNPVFIEDYALAMWRGEAKNDGAIPPVNVWEDRCPHRGMRLSHGFVKGETLCCIYHGWGYQSGDGQCTHIPAHPDLTPPKTIHAKTFPSESRYGIIWTNLAETPAAALSEAGAGTDWTPIRSVYVQKPRTDVINSIQQHAFGEGATVEESEPGILLVKRPTHSLLLAVQTVNDDKTGIHAVAAGQAPDKATTADLAAELVRLRDQIEAA